VLGIGLKSGNLEQSTDAAIALGKSKEESAFKLLVKALKSPKPLVCNSAAVGLREFGDVRAVDLLIEALACRQSFVCSTIASALGELGDARAVEPLIELLRGEDIDKPNPFMSPTELSTTNPNEAASILSLFQGEDALITSVACALGDLGDSRAVTPLIEHLKIKPGELSVVQCAAFGAVAEALGKIGDKRAVEPLLKMKNHPDQRIRDDVTEALDMLRGNTIQEAEISAEPKSLGDVIPKVKAALHELPISDEEKLRERIEWMADKWRVHSSRIIEGDAAKIESTLVKCFKNDLKKGESFYFDINTDTDGWSGIAHNVSFRCGRGLHHVGRYGDKQYIVVLHGTF